MGKKIVTDIAKVVVPIVLSKATDMIMDTLNAKETRKRKKKTSKRKSKKT